MNKVDQVADKKEKLEMFKIDMKRLDAVRQETFLASTYLPCWHDSSAPATASGLEAEIIVCHPEMQNVDLLGIPKVPNRKHLSIHKMKVKYKSLKKVRQVRIFAFDQSVFAKWRKDTDQVLEQAFTLDA